jgi:ketosteroid isomerase-like protein
MPAYSKQEITDAFDKFAHTFDAGLRSGDFTEWLKCLTEDVSYSERGAGIGWDRQVQGRAPVQTWLRDIYARAPQQHVRYRPVAWKIVDSERGWVVSEWRYRLADSGSGQVHEWRVYARLFYAGAGQWSFVEEIYNATGARAAMSQWLADRRAMDAQGIAMPAFDTAWGGAITHQEEETSERWPRADIEAAVKNFDEVCQRAFLSHDHEEWVQCFTDDVIYREMAMSMDDTFWPQMRGRDEARGWINGVFNNFPIDRMMLYPISWYVIDEERAWVVLEWRNQMADPGDGELFEERSYTRLKYGGGGQFRFEEDIYDPSRMREMIVRWMEARRKCLQRPQTEMLMSLASPQATGLPPTRR